MNRHIGEMIDLGTTRGLRRLSGRLARLAGRDVGAAHDWKARFRHAVRQRGVASVLEGHQKASLLDHEFSVGAYLARNSDVADVVASAGEAVFHFLEFGHAEGRHAHPDVWSPSFVRMMHGLSLPETLGPVDANVMLRRSGLWAEAVLLTEADLWATRWLHGAVFAQIFDDEFYAAAADRLGHAVPARCRLAEIGHFCEIGLEKGIPPHPDHVFDPLFYWDALALAGVDAPAAGDDVALRAH